MFWKNAENFPGRRFCSAVSSWVSSITGRLTLLYALSVFGTLVMATGFLYWVLVSNLEKEDSRFLADNVHVLRSILHDHPDDLALLKQEIQWEGPAHRSTKYYVRVLDEKGRLVVETPGMHDLAATMFPFPSSSETHESLEEGTQWRTLNGTPFLLMAAWADLGSAGRERRLLQLALDVSHKEAAIADYRRKLMAVLLGGMVFSAGAGVAIARRGMRPLAEITKTVHRVTATQLHERIGSKQWPNELTALAVAFDKMLDRLEDSFARLSRFSADLAHELRTPLNNLMGETEVALSRARTPDEYRHVIESSSEEYRKLSRMIDNLLFLARAESTKMKIERTWFNASREIGEVREFYEALAEEKGIEVTCTGDAPVNADPILFQRAISNLLSNALTYTPSGGKVAISVTQAGDQSSIEISVKDTGFGIPPEDQPKIFDRFSRGEYARSHYPEGTGLGLAIVKSIMDLHNGTATIQSAPGQGTTAILRFPRTS